MRFVGPSYALNHRKADAQRAVNLMPVPNEVLGGKSHAYLDSVPGLRVFSANDLALLLTETDGYMLTEDGGFILLE